MSDTLINIHPADELAAVRDEIRLLEKRADELRAYFLSPDLQHDDFDGQAYRVAVLTSKRETVDKAALIAELGEEAVKPFLKASTFQTVKVVEK